MSPLTLLANFNSELNCALSKLKLNIMFLQRGDVQMNKTDQVESERHLEFRVTRQLRPGHYHPGTLYDSVVYNTSISHITELTTYTNLNMKVK